MDLSFSSDQVELQELARRILGDAASLERVKAAIATDEGIDRVLWRAMAQAGLIGVSLPESIGGGGCGFLETCIVLEEVGRTAAPVPAARGDGARCDRAVAVRRRRGSSRESRTVTAS